MEQYNGARYVPAPSWVDMLTQPQGTFQKLPDRYEKHRKKYLHDHSRQHPRQDEQHPAAMMYQPQMEGHYNMMNADYRRGEPGLFADGANDPFYPGPYYHEQRPKKGKKGKKSKKDKRQKHSPSNQNVNHVGSSSIPPYFGFHPPPVQYDRPPNNMEPYDVIPRDRSPPGIFRDRPQGERTQPRKGLRRTKLYDDHESEHNPTYATTITRSSVESTLERPSPRGRREEESNLYDDHIEERSAMEEQRDERPPQVVEAQVHESMVTEESPREPDPEPIPEPPEPPKPRGPSVFTVIPKRKDPIYSQVSKRRRPESQNLNGIEPNPEVVLREFDNQFATYGTSSTVNTASKPKVVEVIPGIDRSPTDWNQSKNAISEFLGGHCASPSISSEVEQPYSRLSDSRLSNSMMSAQFIPPPPPSLFTPAPPALLQPNIVVREQILCSKPDVEVEKVYDFAAEENDLDYATEDLEALHVTEPKREVNADRVCKAVGGLPDEQDAYINRHEEPKPPTPEPAKKQEATDDYFLKNVIPNNKDGIPWIVPEEVDLYPPQEKKERKEEKQEDDPCSGGDEAFRNGCNYAESQPIVPEVVQLLYDGENGELVKNEVDNNVSSSPPPAPVAPPTPAASYIAVPCPTPPAVPAPAAPPPAVHVPTPAPPPPAAPVYAPPSYIAAPCPVPAAVPAPAPPPAPAAPVYAPAPAAPVYAPAPAPVPAAPVYAPAPPALVQAVPAVPPPAPPAVVAPAAVSTIPRGPIVPALPAAVSAAQECGAAPSAGADPQWVDMRRHASSTPSVPKSAPVLPPPPTKAYTPAQASSGGTMNNNRQGACQPGNVVDLRHVGPQKQPQNSLVGASNKTFYPAMASKLQDGPPSLQVDERQFIAQPTNVTRSAAVSSVLTPRSTDDPRFKPAISRIYAIPAPTRPTFAARRDGVSDIVPVHVSKVPIVAVQQSVLVKPSGQVPEQVSEVPMATTPTTPVVTQGLPAVPVPVTQATFAPGLFPVQTTLARPVPAQTTLPPGLFPIQTIPTAVPVTIQTAPAPIPMNYSNSNSNSIPVTIQTGQAPIPVTIQATPIQVIPQPSPATVSGGTQTIPKTVPTEDPQKPTTTVVERNTETIKTVIVQQERQDDPEPEESSEGTQTMPPKQFASEGTQSRPSPKALVPEGPQFIPVPVAPQYIPMQYPQPVEVALVDGQFVPVDSIPTGGQPFPMNAAPGGGQYVEVTPTADGQFVPVDSIPSALQSFPMNAAPGGGQYVEVTPTGDGQFVPVNSLPGSGQPFPMNAAPGGGQYVEVTPTADGQFVPIDSIPTGGQPFPMNAAPGGGQYVEVTPTGDGQFVPVNSIPGGGQLIPVSALPGAAGNAPFLPTEVIPAYYDPVTGGIVEAGAGGIPFDPQGYQIVELPMNNNNVNPQIVEAIPSGQVVQGSPSPEDIQALESVPSTSGVDVNQPEPSGESQMDTDEVIETSAPAKATTKKASSTKPGKVKSKVKKVETCNQQ